MTLIAAADGSALGNPGPAGWAWYIDNDRWASGGWPHGTNNMGELTAVLDLLRQTAGLDQDLLVYCDSLYVINSITKWMPGWKRKGWRKGDGKPVLNVEIMQALDEAMRGRRVHFEWIKGHSGHPLNEEADRLANAAAIAYSQGRPPLPGPGIGNRPTRSGAPQVSEGASFASQPPPSELPLSPEGEPNPSNGNAEDDLFSLDQLPPIDAPSGVDDLLPLDEPEPTDEDRVIALERLLLTDEVRSDASAVAALLHADWSEVGRSGRVWTRAELLAQIGPVDVPVRLEVVSVGRVDSQVILLVWRSVGADGSALRSSLWVRDGGDWRQRFHQGTHES